jgi:hypothetical protein
MGNLLPTRRVIRMALLALAPGEQIPNYLLMIDKRDRQTTIDKQYSTNNVRRTKSAGLKGLVRGQQETVLSF